MSKHVGGRSKVPHDLTKVDIAIFKFATTIQLHVVALIFTIS